MGEFGRLGGSPLTPRLSDTCQRHKQSGAERCPPGFEPGDSESVVEWSLQGPGPTPNTEV
jgi:hypothetical protein